ncbi:gremlin-1-like [Artemia franciscana]|uniref:CTCK domain-containing protein n=1 Tax=Artemia franciscana TaxID=6661 RepID=A0AA88L2S6_ARTSF|nr:hypothetical protein QYM36_015900 [Artemia franciscana]KAK2705676.1 hypothetical protein QYM36_015900 [Artemia franciscana]
MMFWQPSSLLMTVFCLLSVISFCLTSPRSSNAEKGRLEVEAAQGQNDDSIAEHIDTDELLRMARTERDTRLLLQRQDKAMEYFRNEVYKRKHKKRQKNRRNRKNKGLPSFMEPKSNNVLPKNLKFNATHSLSLEGSKKGYNGTRLLKGPDLLKSSKDALFVTKKDYLKSDWCKTQPVVQRIKEEGCRSQPFVNNFCYGQCNSFYIPRNVRSKSQIGDDAFKSCAFCKPRHADWKVVTLKCPGMNPPFRKKKVLYVQQCKCITEVLS